MKQNNLSVFLVCLLLATLFWFLNAFTKNYDKVLNLPVRYINLPKNKSVLNDLPENINIEVSTYGFYLLTHNISKTVDTIDISGEMIQEKPGKSSKGFIQTNSLIDRFAEQLGTGVKVKNILTDTIYFDFDKLISKKVPVKANIDFTLEKQFFVEGKQSVTPAFVKVTGPASAVDTMTFVSTEFVSFSNLKESVKKELEIEKENKKITVTPEQVLLKIPVEKFIEATVNIPVSVENVPKKFITKTNPEKVSVKYSVSVKHNEKISVESFNAIVDYNDLVNKNSGKLKVKIIQVPQFVNVLKITPEKVECVVRKK